MGIRCTRMHARVYDSIVDQRDGVMLQGGREDVVVRDGGVDLTPLCREAPLVDSDLPEQQDSDEEEGEEEYSELATVELSDGGEI